jgi:SpoVK/Ycf46/Vps4 family AAA+-type ATPase
MKTMRTLNEIVLALAIATVGLAGCGKTQQPAGSVQVNGVSVDMPKLRQVFSGSSNDQIRKLLFEVDQGFRYKDYLRAIAALEQLSNHAEATDEQKKVVAEVLAQMKKLAASAPAPAH